MQEVSQTTEGRWAAKPRSSGVEPSQNSLFLVDNLVLVGLDRLGMRGAEARCESATDATYEHATGKRRIREALDGCARDAIHSTCETR